MRWQNLSYRIGSWAFMVVGLGHLLSHWLAPSTPEQQAMWASMRQFAVVLPGREGNLYQYHTGFSLMMGLLLVAYGAQAWLLIWRRSGPHEIGQQVIYLHILVAAVGLLVAGKFFFAVPVALMAIALAAFSSTALLMRRSARP